MRLSTSLGGFQAAAKSPTRARQSAATGEEAVPRTVTSLAAASATAACPTGYGTAATLGFSISQTTAARERSSLATAEVTAGEEATTPKTGL